MHIYAIGNALVDLEYRVSDTLLDALELTKGHMALIDDAELGARMSRLDTPIRRCGGGSAANSAAAYVGFGGEAHFCGRVANDDVGRWFINDLQRYGVQTKPASSFGEGTSGQCLVLITDDAERTMLTFLGVSAELRPMDIDEAALASADLLYLEGYMAGSDTATRTCAEAMALARSRNIETALSLSDASMIQFCRANLERFLEEGVTHLFCNLEEAMLLSGADGLESAGKRLAQFAKHVHITLGAKGSVCVAEGAMARARVSDDAVNAIDTTGAGDMYAGTVLYAYAQSASPAQMAAFGNFAAGRIVSHFGARLSGHADYAELQLAFTET